MMMTGTCGWISPSVAMSSKPSMPGMRMSESTVSGASLRACRKAGSAPAKHSTR